MNRICFGIFLSLSGIIGATLTQAQNVPTASEARVLHSSFASVDSPVYAEAIGESAEPANSFPSLSPKFNSPSGQRTRASGAQPFSGSLVTVGSSLAIVLGLFAGLVWVTRRFGSKSMVSGGIPSEVLQPLGSSPIDARTNVTLIRCGTKILVIARTASGVQPISEITEPNEVRHITALCLGDAKKEFATALQEMEKENTNPGYVGAAATSTGRGTSNQRSHGRLFASA